VWREKGKEVEGDHIKDGATSSGENMLLAYKEEHERKIYEDDGNISSNYKSTDYNYILFFL
jgi:hypothetical protein